MLTLMLPILYWLLHDFLIPTIPLNLNAEFPSHMSDLSEAEVLTAERRRIDSLNGSRTTPEIHRLPDFGESNPRNIGLLEAIRLGGLAKRGRRSWF